MYVVLKLKADPMPFLSCKNKPSKQKKLNRPFQINSISTVFPYNMSAGCFVEGKEPSLNILIPAGSGILNRPSFPTPAWEVHSFRKIMCNREGHPQSTFHRPDFASSVLPCCTIKSNTKLSNCSGVPVWRDMKSLKVMIRTVYLLEFTQPHSHIATPPPQNKNMPYMRYYSSWVWITS